MHGKKHVDGKESNHEDGNVEARLCLLAEADIGFFCSDFAALGNVPWRAIVDMLWINGVWRYLAVDAESVQSNFDGVHEEGQNWEEAVERNQDNLGQKDEHAQDGDDEIILRQEATPDERDINRLMVGGSIEWCRGIAVESIV